MQQTQLNLAPASVILRIGAFLIDTILTSLVSLPLMSLVGDSENVSDPTRPDQGTIAVLLVINAIYTIGFTSAMSTTLGKLALGMYIADMKGARIRPDTAILRYIVFLVGHSFFFGTLISFVMVLVNPTRRTIHDRVAGTQVLRRQQGVEAPPPDLT
jgi:uncharacterized RDD family membrane protein YckC